MLTWNDKRSLNDESTVVGTWCVSHQDAEASVTGIAPRIYAQRTADGLCTYPSFRKCVHTTPRHLSCRRRAVGATCQTAVKYLHPVEYRRTVQLVVTSTNVYQTLHISWQILASVLFLFNLNDINKTHDSSFAFSNYRNSTFFSLFSTANTSCDLFIPYHRFITEEYPIKT